MNKRLGRTAATTLLGLAALTALPGCAPLLIGGAMVGSALMVSDRRTTGAQIEDQAIEIKAGSEARRVAPQGHVNFTSYNRMLLITGEVPAAADRGAVEAAVSRVENVRSVVNELAVAGNASLTSRSNDTLLSTQVKASLVDAQDLQANAIKVVTERATVYLMGRLTEREAARAASLASTVPGVQKVVRVVELISEAELARLQPDPGPKK